MADHLHQGRRFRGPACQRLVGEAPAVKCGSVPGRRAVLESCHGDTAEEGGRGPGEQPGLGVVGRVPCPPAGAGGDPEPAEGAPGGVGGLRSQYSGYYRDRYRELPGHIEGVTALPVTNKSELMAHLDDVATDPAVTLAAVQEFVADPARIGERFAGKYLVATTAGTTGTRGIFVLDDRYWAVASGLMGILAANWLSWRDVLRLARRGARFAEVVATGGHFLSVAASTRERREKPRRHRSLGVFSVHTPVPQLVAKLNDFDPALLGGYASVLRLLATEQQAGRLQVHPVLVLSTAEGFAASVTVSSGSSRLSCGRSTGAPRPATPPAAAPRAGCTCLRTG